MTVDQQDFEGADARFSYEELIESDLDPQEKGRAEIMRVDGIRRRYSEPQAGQHNPSMLRADRVREDIAFVLARMQRLDQILQQVAQQRDQAAFAAQRLQERLKRIEAGAEKTLVAPSGRAVRDVLASKR